ncbi:MAG TPA: hypothetical protein VHK89_01150 [Actinomycetota bacterium]|nr:hypothetical protein [Actinomycetota bacterium]
MERLRVAQLQRERHVAQRAARGRGRRRVPGRGVIEGWAVVFRPSR